MRMPRGTGSQYSNLAHPASSAEQRVCVHLPQPLIRSRVSGFSFLEQDTGRQREALHVAPCQTTHALVLFFLHGRIINLSAREDTLLSSPAGDTAECRLDSSESSFAPCSVTNFSAPASTVQSPAGRAGIRSSTETCRGDRQPVPFEDWLAWVGALYFIIAFSAIDSDEPGALYCWEQSGLRPSMTGY